MKRIIEILWTGGFDSTFRVLQLSRLPVVIQPFYLPDGREIQNIELSTIRKITDMLCQKKETKAEIRPVQVVQLKKEELSPEIVEAYGNVLKKDWLGTQYMYIGTFAREHQGIELSIHHEAIELIRKYAELRKISDELIGDYYEVDPLNAGKDILTIFQNCHFPLADYTKLSMSKIYRKWGCEDVMNTTWFCHYPVKGKPCGTCNPCQCTIREGLSERFTRKALFRFYMLPLTGPLKSWLYKYKQRILRRNPQL